MITFSKDTDILRYEPALFFDHYIKDQVLIKGSAAELNGTVLTCAGADFQSAGVNEGNVLTLISSVDGTKIGCYEILSVDSAQQLTVSVLRADQEQSAISAGTSSNADFFIVTYSPQQSQVAYDLTEYFGIQPGKPSSGITVSNIMNQQALLQTTVLAVISGIYATIASSADDEPLWRKSLHYKKLFEKARESCQLHIDVGLDGIADFTMVGSSVRLVRD